MKFFNFFSLSSIQIRMNARKTNFSWKLCKKKWIVSVAEIYVMRAFSIYYIYRFSEVFRTNFHKKKTIPVHFSVIKRNFY